MAEPKEPQSYGSQASWTSGDVDQEVNRQKGHPSSQHAAFYSSHREKEENAPEQGGLTSPFQAADSAQPVGRAEGEELPVQKVTDQRGGAKTDSFFKKRDYE